MINGNIVGIKKNVNISIEKVINEYIKKICECDNLNKTFDSKLNNITILTDNLIDYCIKKKIFYFIENKISYTSIIRNFKSHLGKFIKDLVDPNCDIINKYIINTQDDNISMSMGSMGKMGWDNVSDLNSIMFKNFKNLNESFEKNVSFGQLDITNYDDGFDGFTLNNDTNNANTNTNTNTNDDNLIIDNKSIDRKILPIYIKLLLNQNKYLVEFTDKLITMCKTLSEPDIKYKKVNPYN
jgi:hypothetical protein